MVASELLAEKPPQRNTCHMTSATMSHWGIHLTMDYTIPPGHSVDGANVVGYQSNSGDVTSGWSLIMVSLWHMVLGTDIDRGNQIHMRRLEYWTYIISPRHDQHSNNLLNSIDDEVTPHLLKFGAGGDSKIYTDHNDPEQSSLIHTPNHSHLCFLPMSDQLFWRQSMYVAHCRLLTAKATRTSGNLSSMELCYQISLFRCSSP